MPSSCVTHNHTCSNHCSHVCYSFEWQSAPIWLFNCYNKVGRCLHDCLGGLGQDKNINCWLIIVKFIQLYTATSDIISRFRSVIGNHLQKNSHHLYIITWYLYWRGKLVNIFLIGTRQCQRWLKFNILHYIFSKGQ